MTISYRRPQFDERRVKHWLLPDIAAQIDVGTIRWLPETAPAEIKPGHVLLMPIASGLPAAGEPIRHETDFVLLMTGYRGDQVLLEMAGVELHGPNRVPIFNDETMETNFPSLFLPGTVVDGIQQHYTVFVENSHEHVGKITRALTGHWPRAVGSVSARTSALTLEQIEAN